MRSIVHAASIALAFSATLAACGGGGGYSSNAPPPPPVMNQSVGGIWEATTTVSGVQVRTLALVSEDGRFYSEALNLSNNCGSVATGSVDVNGDMFSGTAISALVLFATDSNIQVGCTYADGSNYGTAKLSGTVVERSTLTLTSTFTTSAGTVAPTETGTLTFNALYNESSSLAKLAGSWTGPTGVVTTIKTDGTFSAQDPSTGCTVNGAYSLIDETYNAYAGRATYANCQGGAAVLNGLTATGLVTLDDTVTPNQLDGGASVTLSNGTVIIVVATATR